MNNPQKRTPKKWEVWSVKDIWPEKAEFLKCSQAERLPRHLDKHDGFACVPYKSRPVIVFREDMGSGVLVCRCSSENEDGTSRSNRVRIGDIGLGTRSLLYYEPPRQYSVNFFGEYKCKAPFDVCKFVSSQMQRILLKSGEMPVASKETNDFEDVLGSVDVV